MRTALVLGSVLVLCGAVACTIEGDPDSNPSPSNGSSSSGYVPSQPSTSSGGTSGQTSSGETSSGNSSSGASSSSSSGSLPPPPPPPQKLPGECMSNGTILPAGPAPREQPGDCYKDVCDGLSPDGLHKYDATDTGTPPDDCKKNTCSPNGVTTESQPNGTACGAAGSGNVCFVGKCTSCKPQNPASCGTEGGQEPANNDPATAASFTEYSPLCAYSDGADIDWYTFYARDDDFVTDVFNFQFWSTAQDLEVCVYVKCGYGTPSGCNGGKAGPNGSYGCCWSGAPNTLSARWDMDCSGTSEDSGTAYVSVRTPGGDACEPYLIYGGY